VAAIAFIVGAENPHGAESSALKHGTVPLDSTQDLRERVHSILWPICKLPWSLGKSICFRKPFEQVMATLGHGCGSEGTAQLQQ
jgi:hypothetical protein